MNPAIPLSIKLTPGTRISRGDLDEINPEDIIYGEYSSDGGKKHGEYLDLLYLDGDVVRTFSGQVISPHPVLENLKILLQNDEKFYLATIKEVPFGVAFKRNDIVNIVVDSLIEGNSKHGPSCVWTLQFEDGSIRTVESNYQSYFAYANTERPASMTNVDVLEKVFPKGK